MTHWSENVYPSKRMMRLPKRVRMWLGERLVGIDDWGDPIVPHPPSRRCKGEGWWRGDLNLHNPRHWPPYLISRLLNAHAMVDTG